MVDEAGKPRPEGRGAVTAFDGLFARMVAEKIIDKLASLNHEIRKVPSLEEHRRIAGKMEAFEAVLAIMKQTEDKLRSREG